MPDHDELMLEVYEAAFEAGDKEALTNSRKRQIPICSTI